MHGSVVDVHVRRLLERYVALSGAAVTELAPNLVQLSVPPADRAAFGRRSEIRIAFSVEAMEEDSNAEIAIIGSAFVDQLISAISRRGTRVFRGRLAQQVDTDGELPAPVPVANGGAGPGTARVAYHRVGKLTAVVQVRAGADMKEHLADSDLLDLCTGAALPLDVARACEAAATPGDPRAEAQPGGAEAAALLPVPDSVSRMLTSLEQRLQPEIEAQATQARAALAHELARIERYYKAVLEDLGGRGSGIPDRETREAIKLEHKRRALEEKERHRVRASVRPLQMAEWELAVQRVEWRVESQDGHSGVFVAQRVLAGDATWQAVCPSCGAEPGSLHVCRENHVACNACSNTCTVCGESFCRDHGTVGCHVDGGAVCRDHVRTCLSCRNSYCTSHEGECEESGHTVCTLCLGACTHCGRVVCDAHAVHSSPEAPRGVRRLCSRCVCTCEGGTGEIVGPDEVTGCASCSRVVCERHQARCSVDGLVHCSTHLRRADRSRRLACEAHRGECMHEPNAVFASDEVVPCATCRGSTCKTHASECDTDKRTHCLSHLSPAGDLNGGYVCEQHRSVCHVDNAVFTEHGTSICSCCGRLTCSRHHRECRNCGRRVCVRDYAASAPDICATCRALQDVDDLPDILVSSIVAAQSGEPAKAKRRRWARDAEHFVVELDIGWSRRLVFSVPHAGGRVDRVAKHSMLGRKIS